MKGLFLLPALFLLLFNHTFSQNVAINSSGDAPHSSAALDISSTSGGLLIPRMTQAQRMGISSPANGLMVYQTDGSAGFYYHNGSAWGLVGSSPDAVLRTTAMVSGDSTLTGTKDQIVIMQGTGPYTITLPASPAVGQVISLICSVPTATVAFPGKEFWANGSLYCTDSINVGTSLSFYMLEVIYDGSRWVYVPA
jgi:hypothetical protein